MSTGIKTTAAVAVLLIAQSAAALTPAERCEAGKLKTAGKYGFCRLKAEAKAVKTGDSRTTASATRRSASSGARPNERRPGVCPTRRPVGPADVHHPAHRRRRRGAVRWPASRLPRRPCRPATATSAPAPPISPPTRWPALQRRRRRRRGLRPGRLRRRDLRHPGLRRGHARLRSGCAFDTSACWNARFADNANGTITDNETGLMWEKKTELDGSANFANLHEADNVYRWAGTCS